MILTVRYSPHLAPVRPPPGGKQLSNPTLCQRWSADFIVTIFIYKLVQLIYSAGALKSTLIYEMSSSY
jgi:hypothetical protein